MLCKYSKIRIIKYVLYIFQFFFYNFASQKTIKIKHEQRTKRSDGGGYIGIGAEEKAGKLVQPAKGLDPDSKNSEKIYYIRKLASTIETPSLDEKELMSIAHNIPFHDRVNPKVEMSS